MMNILVIGLFFPHPCGTASLRRVVAIRLDRIALLFEMSRDQTMHRRVGDQCADRTMVGAVAACDLASPPAPVETPESLARRR